LIDVLNSLLEKFEKAQKKVLGLALGEKSLLAAELIAGDRPEVVRLAEWVYPDGLWPARPAELGKALGQFLQANQFSARAAVIGIPAKWIIVKSKEVPPADTATLVQMLRLQAEAEFSTELRDLVYDFVADAPRGPAKSVLLIATSKKYPDAINAMCHAAKIKPLFVTPTALALGEMTGEALDKEVLVLAVSAGGSELFAQHGTTAGAIRSLRPPTPAGPFVNELRRAVSTLAPVAAGREMVLWGGDGEDADSLRDQLGLPVRAGDLPSLGVNATGHSANGEGRKFAAAVALAASALGRRRPAVDFLHSRLAAPAPRRFPQWAVWSAGAAAVLLIICLAGWADLAHQQSKLDALNAQINDSKDEVAAAADFVSRVTAIQHWHGGDQRYVACLCSLTSAIPEDGETYATSLTVAEAVRFNSGSAMSTSSSQKSAEDRSLSCQLVGKTSDQQHARALVDRISGVPGFSDVILNGTQDAARERQVSFSITFTYTPPKIAS
jgi:hypothetical protein